MDSNTFHPVKLVHHSSRLLFSLVGVVLQQSCFFVFVSLTSAIFHPFGLALLHFLSLHLFKFTNSQGANMGLARRASPQARRNNMGRVKIMNPSDPAHRNPQPTWTGPQVCIKKTGTCVYQLLFFGLLY